MAKARVIVEDEASKEAIAAQEAAASNGETKPASEAAAPPAVAAPAEPAVAAATEAAAPASNEDEEVVVTIGDEQPPEAQPAPVWVRELRQKHKDDQQKIRELELKLAGQQTPAALGSKPTLAEHDYDETKYEAALDKWHADKLMADLAEAKVKEAEQQQQKSWQDKIASYNTAKQALKVQDFEEAEASAQAALSVTQQGIIVQGSNNPALTVYALGSNPVKLAELAAIKDPVKFAFAIAQLETTMKVTKRGAPPPPEKQAPASTGSLAGTVDATLERLREEAAKIGDYSKLHKYKAANRAKAAA